MALLKDQGVALVWIKSGAFIACQGLLDPRVYYLGYELISLPGGILLSPRIKAGILFSWGRDTNQEGECPNS
jgi:hypothetical protein